MRTLEVLGLVGCLAGMGASAAPKDTLLSRDNGSGYVRPENVYSSSCHISAKSVHIKIQRADGNNVDKTEKVQWNADIKNLHQLRAQIQIAARGKVNKSTAPTDGPSYKYQAYTGGFRPKSVILKQYYSGADLKNDSAATDALVKFTDQNCGPES